MMSCTFKKKLLPSVMAAALASGAAFSNNAQAIHLAEEGLGQVLLAPYYKANEGYKTRFAIVNTLTDTAVKVKIVLRSRAHSTEALDFICYMTPADVCRFEVRNINGQAYMWTDDDSIRADASTFASQVTGGVQQILFDEDMLEVDQYDINEIGHVEVIGAYGVRGTVQIPTRPSGDQFITITRGMSKQQLAKIFDLTPWVGQVIGDIASNDPTRVQLTGAVEIIREDNADRMGYSIPALAGAIGDNIPAVAVAAPNGHDAFDGRVIANPFYDVNVSAESTIGTSFGSLGLDNLLEIEHALAATNIEGTYEDDANSSPAGMQRTSQVVTFPTKYRHRGYTYVTTTGSIEACGTNVLATNYPADFGARLIHYTPPFTLNGHVVYGMTAYDNQEHSPTAPVNIPIFSGGPATQVVTNALVNEVNYFHPSWPATTADGFNYESGWFNLSLVAQTGCGSYYAGVPTLSLVHKYHEIDTGVPFNSMIIAPAHN